MPNPRGQPTQGDEVLLTSGSSAVIAAYERTLPGDRYVVRLSRPCRQEFATVALYDPQEAFWKELALPAPVRAPNAYATKSVAPDRQPREFRVSKGGTGQWVVVPWYTRLWRWVRTHV